MAFNTNSNSAAKNAEKEENISVGLGWNDEISNDGGEFVVFPEGEYTFKVLKLEKSFQDATDRIPGGCNKAILTLQLVDPQTEQTTSFKENLLLINTSEWKLCAFFRSIGLKKHGEKLIMDWSKVVGSCGKCKVSVREFTNSQGQIRKANQVEKFLDPDDSEPWN